MKLLINLPNGKSEKFDSKLLYCLTCQQIKTQSSVTYEICSFYCPHCLEKVGSSEVSSNLGNCRKCFLCPCCDCSLAVITLMQDNKEVYYFKCNYCKWDSLHSEEKIAGDSPEYLFRTAILMDQEKNDSFKKTVEQFENKINKIKKEEEQNNMPKFHTHLFGKKVSKDFIGKLSSTSGTVSTKEKYTMGQMQEKLEVSEKEINPKPSTVLEKKENKTSSSTNKKEDVEHFLSENNVITIKKETYDYSLSSFPNETPKKKLSSKKNHPNRQKLFSKCSIRCLECDKLLIRPELGDSVSFQRLHLSLKYLPNLHSISLKEQPFEPSKPNTVTFALLNPLSCEVNVTISDLSAPFSFSGENSSSSSLSLVLKPNTSLFFPQKSSSHLVPFSVDYNPTQDSSSSSFSFQFHIEYTGSVEKHQKTILPLTLVLI